MKAAASMASLTRTATAALRTSAASGASSSSSTAAATTTSRAAARCFSTSSAAKAGYEDTIKNILVQADSRVICQGFTGKTVSIGLGYEGLEGVVQRVRLRGRGRSRNTLEGRMPMRELTFGYALGVLGWEWRNAEGKKPTRPKHPEPHH